MIPGHVTANYLVTGISYRNGRLFNPIWRHQTRANRSTMSHSLAETFNYRVRHCGGSGRGGIHRAVWAVTPCADNNKFCHGRRALFAGRAGTTVYLKLGSDGPPRRAAAWQSSPLVKHR